jgi:energy-coupling factor transporter ATP-binding protein EcfA2
MSSDGDDDSSGDWLVELPLEDEATKKDTKKRTAVRADRAFGELSAELELWKSASGVPYATLPVGDHFENWPVESSRFKDWIRWRAQLRRESLINASDLDKLVGALRAQALYGGNEFETWTRIGTSQGRVYIDLGCPKWRCIEIWPAEMDRDERWRILEAAPVKFIRRQTMRPMAEPTIGGSIDDLRPFLNVETEGDFRLAVGWIVSSFRPRGPYPLCVISGTQGSGKSTLLRLFSRLCDPVQAPERNLPREERDLFVTASNTHLQTFDNLSNINTSMSDALCRVATGGGYSARALHTNDEEHILQACKPIVVNGISSLARRGDLADRSIQVTAAALVADRRLPEEEYWSRFAHVEGQMLGVIFDAVSWALQAYPKTPAPPVRMSDAARFMEAAAESFGWEQGTYAELLKWNRNQANEAVIEADVFASALVNLLAEKSGEWRGSTSELLEALTARVPEKVRRAPFWPITTAATTAALSRVKDALESVGYTFERGREGPKNDRRYLQFARLGSED